MGKRANTHRLSTGHIVRISFKKQCDKFDRFAVDGIWKVISLMNIVTMEGPSLQTAEVNNSVGESIDYIKFVLIEQPQQMISTEWGHPKINLWKNKIDRIWCSSASFIFTKCNTYRFSFLFIVKIFQSSQKTRQRKTLKTVFQRMFGGKKSEYIQRVIVNVLPCRAARHGNDGD